MLNDEAGTTADTVKITLFSHLQTQAKSNIRVMKGTANIKHLLRSSPYYLGLCSRQIIVIFAGLYY